MKTLTQEQMQRAVVLLEEIVRPGNEGKRFFEAIREAQVLLGCRRAQDCWTIGAHKPKPEQGRKRGRPPKPQTIRYPEHRPNSTVMEERL